MKDYKFFNKPFGFRHFLEHGEFFVVDNDSEEGVEFGRPDDIVILCDPDFLLLRPITDDFSNEAETLMRKDRKIILNHRSRGKRIVEHGNPFAQTWDGLGTTWLTYNAREIAGDGSPAIHVDESDTTLFYMVGPPYIGTGRDMLNIAVKWTEFAPAVLKENPLHHAEMCKCSAVQCIMYTLPVLFSELVLTISCFFAQQQTHITWQQLISNYNIH